VDRYVPGTQLTPPGLVLNGKTASYARTSPKLDWKTATKSELRMHWRSETYPVNMLRANVISLVTMIFLLTEGALANGPQT
jgi:hypothetical protein